MKKSKEGTTKIITSAQLARKVTKEEKFEYCKEYIERHGIDNVLYFNEKFPEMRTKPREIFNAWLKIQVFKEFENGEKDDKVLIRKKLGSKNTIRGYRIEYNEMKELKKKLISQILQNLVNRF